MRNVRQTIEELPARAELPVLDPPPYRCGSGVRLGLAVRSMRHHMTDEGWQIFQGLNANRYILAGNQLAIDGTDVAKILRQYQPGTVVLQDKREWDGTRVDFRDPADCFTNVEALRDRDDIFKVTILKDAHQNPMYHARSAEEAGIHAWIVYYHPEIVTHLATYVRPQHVIRTHHSIDPALVPLVVNRRGVALLSGAVSSAYPMRQSLLTAYRQGALKHINVLPHPGYHRDGCCTAHYLQLLSQYRVALCTSSRYGYLLRKIVEATACGCIVVTDLPTDEVVPAIDGNLVRVEHNSPPHAVDELCRELASSYSLTRQREYSDLAKVNFGYYGVGRRLAAGIEAMRMEYV